MWFSNVVWVPCDYRLNVLKFKFRHEFRYLKYYFCYLKTFRSLENFRLINNGHPNCRGET